MKKIISMILALGMGASLITGCGAAQQGAANAETQPQGDVSVTADAGEDIPENTYIIYVKDADSDDPVAGAMVQLCTDVECRNGMSDEDGKAVFEAEPTDYSVHMIKAPEGYEKSEEEINLTADVRTGTYKLKKSGEAAEDESSEAMEDMYSKTNASWDFPFAGFELAVPENFKDYKGQIVAGDVGTSETDFDIVEGFLGYLGRSDEEYEAILEKTRVYNASEEHTDEENEQYAAAVDEYYSLGNMPFLYVIGAKEGKTYDEALEAVLGDIPVVQSGELGKAGSYTYYYAQPDVSDYREGFEDPFSEYDSLAAEIDKITPGITVKGPKETKYGLETGATIAFETTDLDGNAVTSEQLFADHKVTMINIWATWCGPCKAELAKLEEFGKELAGKDCQIIGICDDTLEGDAKIKEAKEILEENGVTYVNLIQTEEMKSLLGIDTYPSSYFVDSTGKVLTPAVKGAYFEHYRQRFEEALQAAQG